ncbi:hypothetical protein F5B20DRAFT_594643 [Whalleya microplaca]|nr:hypothetical protein F5B20DRAFT_594643 [Whalleya microplaca]
MSFQLPIRPSSAPNTSFIETVGDRSEDEKAHPESKNRGIADELRERSLGRTEGSIDNPSKNPPEEADEIQLLSNGPQDVKEQEVWKTLLHRFDCLPRDLFTYGLKIDIYPGKYQLWCSNGSKVPDMKMGNGLGKHLAKLLFHPIWKNDISRVRYALQMAVCARFTDHVRPFASLEYTEEPAWSSGAEASQFRSWVQKNTGMTRDPEIVQVVNALNTFIENKRPAWCEAERCLFLLRPRDVEVLRFVLERTERIGLCSIKYEPCYYKKASYYYRQNIKNVNDEFSSLLAIRYMRDWDKISILAEKRDSIIRARSLMHNLPKYALWDVPHRDLVTFTKYL